MILPPDLSAYTANEVLYGVAGGLSGGILICIIIIIVLLITRSPKSKDVEKDELIDDNSSAVNHMHFCRIHGAVVRGG